MSATRSSRRSRDRVHAELTALLGSGGPLAAAPDGLVDFFTEEIQREIIFEYRERRPDVIDLALELRQEQELGDLAAAELADVDWLAADLPSTIGSALPKCGAEPPAFRSSDRDGGAGQVPISRRRATSRATSLSGQRQENPLGHSHPSRDRPPTNSALVGSGTATSPGVQGWHHLWNLTRPGRPAPGVPSRMACG